MSVKKSRSGVLDHPLSRMMTTEVAATFRLFGNDNPI
jgi:hypothetical protein